MSHVVADTLDRLLAQKSAQLEKTGGGTTQTHGHPFGNLVRQGRSASVKGSAALTSLFLSLTNHGVLNLRG